MIGRKTFQGSFGSLVGRAWLLPINTEVIISKITTIITKIKCMIPIPLGEKKEWESEFTVKAILRLKGRHRIWIIWK